MKGKTLIMHVSCGRLNQLSEVLVVSNPSPDVSQDMVSRIERAKIDITNGNTIVPASKRRKVPLEKQSRCRVATGKHQTSRTSRIVNSNSTLYTLFNGVTGHVDGNISL